MRKAIMNWIDRLIKKYWHWREKRYLKRMIHEAKRMHLATGKRYHVVPMDDGKLKVVDNDFIKEYNRLNFVKKIPGLDLLKMAIYSTKMDGLDKRLEELRCKKQL